MVVLNALGFIGFKVITVAGNIQVWSLNILYERKLFQSSFIRVEDKN